jgi:hypothetical protein
MASHGNAPLPADHQARRGECHDRGNDSEIFACCPADPAMGQRTGLGTRLEQAARLSPVEVRPNLVAGWLSPEEAAGLIVALLAPADRITLVFAVTTLGALAGLGGRCRHIQGGRPCDVLGCTCYGRHCTCREDLRRDCAVFRHSARTLTQHKPDVGPLLRADCTCITALPNLIRITVAALGNL